MSGLQRRNGNVRKRAHVLGNIAEHAAFLHVTLSHTSVNGVFTRCAAPA